MIRLKTKISSADAQSRQRVIAFAGPVAVVLACLRLTLGAQAPQLGRPTEPLTERGVVRRVFLEVRLAETEPVRGLTIDARVKDSGAKVYIHYAKLITTTDVSKATVVERGDRYSVSLMLTPEGKARMTAGTSRHQGRPLAIILDGEVVALLMLQSSLSDAIVIPRSYTRAEAMTLSSGLVW